MQYKAESISLDELQPIFDLAVNCAQQQHYKKAEQLFYFLFQKKFLPSRNKENGRYSKDLYEKNVHCLKAYDYIFHTEFPSYNQLPAYYIQITDKKYILFDIEEKKLKQEYIMQDEREKIVFFRESEKKQPLLIQNEINFCNIKFLCDTMRCSEDFGGDNHIYLYYDSIERFCSYLQIVDFEEVLKSRKLIFLFGEEELNKYYPLDFNTLFHMNYNAMKCQPIRLEELKQVCFFDVGGFGFSGTQFLSEIMDWHPNLLTLPMYHANVFPLLYQHCFKGKSTIEMLYMMSNNVQIKSGIEELDQILEHWLKNLEFYQILADLLKNIEKPSKLEWFKAFYLAYALQEKRNFTGRMTPVIYYDPHWSSHAVRFCMDLLKEFPYFNVLTIIRDNVAQFDSATHNFFKKKEKMVSNSAVYHLHYFFSTRSSLLNLRSWYKDKLSNIFEKKITDDFVDRSIGTVRFEDLKLCPRATLWSLCEYLNLSWDDTLLNCTQKGETSNTGGFDPTPVQRRWKECYSEFDAYRLECLFADVYFQYGYDSKFYDKKQYTKEEILHLCLQFFELEKLDIKLNLYKQKRRYEWILWLVNWIYSPEAETMRQNKVLFWIKPKAELINGSLYT